MKKQFKRFVYLMLSFMFLAIGIVDVPRPASASTTVPLSSLSVGNTVNLGGKTWMVLNPDTGYLLLQDFYGGNRAFDPDNTNTFDPSDTNNIAYYLNDTFYNSLTPTDRPLIQFHDWGIGASDGYDDESTTPTVTCNIGLISYSEYLDYGINPSAKFWTRTPYSGDSHLVWCAATGGSLVRYSANSSYSVRPALYLSPDILVDGGNGGTVTQQLDTVSGLTVATSSSAAAGTAFDVAVTARDADGYRIHGYTGTVHFTSTDANAVLPTDYTFTAGDNGTHTFTGGVTLTTAGTQTVTATDTGGSTITGTMENITVNPGTPSAGQSTVAASVYSLTANGTDASTITATLIDACGNLVSGKTVTLDQGSGSSTITPVSSATESDGTATFTVTDTKAETVTYTATVTPDNVTVNQTVTVTFLPGQVESLNVSAIGTQTAGTPFDVTVTAKDACGNTVPGYTGTVTFASSEGSNPGGTSPSLPQDYTFTTTDAGTHTFSNGVTFYNAAMATVTATDTENSTITGTTESITVNPGPPNDTILSVSAPSVPADGHSADTVSAVVYDVYDNPVPNIPLNFSTDLGSLGSSVVTTDGNGRAADTITSTTAGTATVQVSGGGQSSSVQVVFTPTMVVTGLSPDYGPVAGGMLVTVEGTGLDTVDAVYFGSVAGTVYGTPSSVVLSVYAPPGPIGGGSVYVVVYGPGGPSAETPAGLYNYLTPVPAPTIDPNGGAFTSPVSVTISNIAAGCDCYYNLSNAVPTQGSERYIGPFTVSRNSSVTAAVYDPVHGLWSPTSTAYFTIQVAEPTADPPDGSTVANNTTVTLADSTPGATIYYTTDGSDPDTDSPSGTSVTISGAAGAAVTVKAFAVKAGMTDSDIATFTYTIKTSSGDSSGGGSSAPANSDSKPIGAETGGSVRFSNATVEVPAGALPTDATLKVTQMSASEANKVMPQGLRVKLGSDIYEITTTGDRDFGDNTVTIRIAYDPAKIGDGEQPTIRYRDETTGQWVDLPTTVEQGADGKWYAETHVNHLTKFAVFSAQVPEPVKKVIVLTLGQQAATVDGSPYTLDGVPFAAKGRTMVPIRFVSEALGAEVDWQPVERQVIITDGATQIVLTLDTPLVLVNNQPALLEAPATASGGRTFVPLRFVSETLGAVVDYDPVIKQITITG